MRDRLEGGIAPELVEYVTGPGIRRDSDHVWAYALAAHRAHAVALRDVPQVPRDAVAALLDALERLAAEGPTSLDLDADLEDLYHAVERTLNGRIGPEATGWLQTGRSRNDHLACVARMWAREELLAVVGTAGALRAKLLHLARDHLDTVVTGYTHQQPAQPITFGHYLLGVGFALQRDVERLVDAWSRLNRCPLGAGSMAGISWRLDRDRLAASLAFDAPTGNSLDSVASRDVVHEVVAGFALLGVTLSRLATDLQQYATWEFGLVEVDDALAAVSSVMPQKKNPVTFEHCRGAAAHVLGAWVAMTTSVKGTPFAHHRESSVESMRPFAEASFQTKKSLALMTASLGGLRVDRARMAAAARINFSTMTDLADALVRTGGLSFRSAHGVVGEAVRRTLADGGSPAALTTGFVRDLVEELTGVAVDLDEDALAGVTDPAASVRARAVAGGPARESTLAQHAHLGALLDADVAWWTDRRARLDAIDAQLRDPGADGVPSGPDGG